MLLCDSRFQMCRKKSLPDYCEAEGRLTKQLIAGRAR
jgi:hypothetical protein